MLFRFVALHVTTCSSGVIREKGRAAPGDTVTPSRGGVTPMKIWIFLRLNLQEHWTNDHLERREGASGDDDLTKKGHHILSQKRWHHQLPQWVTPTLVMPLTCSSTLETSHVYCSLSHGTVANVSWRKVLLDIFTFHCHRDSARFSKAYCVCPESSRPGRVRYEKSNTSRYCEWCWDLAGSWFPKFRSFQGHTIQQYYNSGLLKPILTCHSTYFIGLSFLDVCILM